MVSKLHQTVIYGGSVVLFPTGITLLGEQTSRNRNPPPVRDDATGSLSNGDFFGGLSFALPRGLPRVPCAYRLAVSRGFRAPSSSRFPAVFDLQPRSERRLSTIEARHRNSSSTLNLPRTPRGPAVSAVSVAPTNYTRVLFRECFLPFCEKSQSFHSSELRLA